jgi:hypothetical protein
MDEVLAGGVANAGAVRRRGDVVVRPCTEHSSTIHAFLRALRAVGFTGAPEPLSLSDTEEELRFVDGDVAIPPYPAWAQTDDALASVATLLRRFHDASAHVSAPDLDGSWSDAFGAPSPVARVICHLDVCLENVVFRNGMAVALLDFDFAAPGDPLDDVASFARMCVPVDDGVRREQLAWTSIDVGRRLRVVLDAYGASSSDRAGFVDRLDRSIVMAERFVRTRVERGEPNFVAMWESFGGEQRFVRRREWFDSTRGELHRTVCR